MLCDRFVSILEDVYGTSIELAELAKDYKNMNCFTMFLLQVLLVVTVFLINYIILYTALNLLNRVIKITLKKELHRKLKRIIPVCIIAFLILLGIYNMLHIERTSYSIFTEHKFSNADRKYRVILIADIHYGPTSFEETLVSLQKKVNSENADLVLILGDVVDENSTYEDMQTVFAYLGNLDSKYGLYFIYGNHDRQMLKKESARDFSQEELDNTICNNGIIILKDNMISINDDIILVGREDYSMEEERLSIVDLMEDVPAEKYVLMMNHTPQESEESEQCGVDLLVAGHTHNGQVWPLNWFLSWFANNSLMYGMEESTETEFKQIVTSGVGGWALPIRNSSPAQYVVIDIVSQP